MIGKWIDFAKIKTCTDRWRLDFNYLKEEIPLTRDVDNLKFVACSELLTGGVKNESRFESIDGLPWAAATIPDFIFNWDIVFDY